mgnify:CR=1 FL=1
MNKIARAYLYFMAAVLAGIGFTGLFAPEIIGHQLGLAPESLKGTAEIRGLYGGGVLSWCVITLAGLRCKALFPGLLGGLGILMGGIAAGRVVSLIIDHEIELNIPAGTMEALIALSCWVIYRHDKAARAIT